ncbi:MAG: hypothetical protein HC909_02935 [Blastochloris sp.]|nr:hypothetical protein [Blastochloris sp.]
MKAKARNGAEIDDSIIVTMQEDIDRGAAEVIWDWLSTSDSGGEAFAPVHELRPIDAYDIILHVLELLKRDMRERQGSAYIWMPASRGLTKTYDRLMDEMVAETGYRVVKLPGGESALVHPNATVSKEGKVLDENPDEVFPELPEDSERAQAAFRAALSEAPTTELRSARPRRGGDEGAGETGGALRDEPALGRLGGDLLSSFAAARTSEQRAALGAELELREDDGRSRYVWRSGAQEMGLDIRPGDPAKPGGSARVHFGRVSDDQLVFARMGGDIVDADIMME